MVNTTRSRKLARSVSIAGVGICKFGAFPTKTSRDLFVEAFKDMQNNLGDNFNNLFRRRWICFWKNF